jgi:glycosyltransferase involved in cell wall biosynthesis
VTSRKPTFSIGITTFKRKDLLKQALDSVLSQNESDVEVLIGNDCVEDPLINDDLGIRECRVRIFNHAKQLGETGNMNFLLNQASGRYFTWLADDDLHNPGYLSAARKLFDGPESPEAVFASYEIRHGLDIGQRKPSHAAAAPWMMNGRTFVHEYLEGNLRIIGVYGFFKRDWLISLGGIERLCDSNIGLYGEYMLVVRCAELTTIAYIPEPLISYRYHPGSRGPDLDVVLYAQASVNLLNRALPLLAKHQAYLESDSRALFRLCLHFHYFRVKREGRAGLLSVVSFAHLLKQKVLVSKTPAVPLLRRALTSESRALLMRAAWQVFSSMAPLRLRGSIREIAGAFRIRQAKPFWN